MAPSTAVVGTTGNVVRVVALSPALYRGASFESASTPLPAHNFSLHAASLQRDANGTTLRFTRRLQAPTGEAVPMIFAFGDGDAVTYHGQRRGAFSELFESAGTLPLQPSVRRSTPSEDRSALRTHGQLMLIAWVGLVAPGAGIGTIYAALSRPRSPQKWRARWRSLFYLHLLFQVAGVVVATVSFALIVARRREHRPPFSPNINFAHGKVGVSAMTILWAQYLLALPLLRPAPGPALLRRAWELTHAMLGRAALTLGVVNVFSGIYIAGLQFHIVAFDSWTAWAATALGFSWVACAMISKLLQGPQRTLVEAEEIGI